MSNSQILGQWVKRIEFRAPCWLQLCVQQCVFIDRLGDRKKHPLVQHALKTDNKVPPVPPGMQVPSTLIWRRRNCQCIMRELCTIALREQYPDPWYREMCRKFERFPARAMMRAHKLSCSRSHGSGSYHDCRVMRRQPRAHAHLSSDFAPLV